MKVLFTIDYSRHARNAVNFFRRMLVPAGSDLYLLHVTTPEEMPVPSSEGGMLHVASAISSLRARAIVHAKQVLAQMGNLLKGQSVQLHPLVVEGNPGQEILKAIHEHQISLVVVGSRGLSMFSSFLLGSVSEWVLNEAPCSVLVGRPESHRKRTSGPMRILLAVDGSADSWAAVDLLPTLTFPKSSKVTVMHVVRKQVYQTERVLLADAASRDQFAKLAAELLEARGREGVDLFERVRVRLESSGLKIEERLVFGNEAQEILKAARQTRADLVVMGSRGLTGLRRLLLGGVSYKVARNAPCSVLIARPAEAHRPSSIRLPERKMPG